MLSFYYTEQVAFYVKNKNPVMQSIKDIYNTKYTESIDCNIINDRFIIPGLNGKYVNIDASFYNMISKEYNENLLVFNEIKPKISIENHKDKIIIKGNSKKNSVSILFEEKNNLSEYLISQNYQINLLIEEQIYPKHYELINNSKMESKYYKIDSYLNKNKINKQLCYTTNDNIPKLCDNKYIFTHSIIVNHSNISIIKNNISSGDIIVIKDTLTLEELKILLNEINYKGLSIIPISKLISESST